MSFSEKADSGLTYIEDGASITIAYKAASSKLLRDSRLDPLMFSDDEKTSDASTAARSRVNSIPVAIVRMLDDQRRNNSNNLDIQWYNCSDFIC